MNRRGFTLVELMIVVCIVGVLAVLAVVGYRKLTLNAKMTEATGMVSAIRVAQEDYKVERGVYADVGPNPCPDTGLAVPLIKTQWQPTCPGGGTAIPATWTILPVHTDGPVQFGYSTMAAGAPNGYGFVNMTALDVTKPWYVVHAVADLDGAGVPNTELVATSNANTIWTNADGQ